MPLTSSEILHGVNREEANQLRKFQRCGSFLRLWTDSDSDSRQTSLLAFLLPACQAQRFQLRQDQSLSCPLKESLLHVSFVSEPRHWGVFGFSGTSLKSSRDAWL